MGVCLSVLDKLRYIWFPWFYPNILTHGVNLVHLVWPLKKICTCVLHQILYDSYLFSMQTWLRCLVAFELPHLNVHHVISITYSWWRKQLGSFSIDGLGFHTHLSAPIWSGRSGSIWSGRSRSIWLGRSRWIWSGRSGSIWLGRSRSIWSGRSRLIWSGRSGSSCGVY